MSRLDNLTAPMGGGQDSITVEHRGSKTRVCILALSLTDFMKVVETRRLDICKTRIIISKI